MSELSDEPREIPIQGFIVDEKPFACWGVNEADNLLFIRSIDAQYFSLQADTLGPLIETERKQRAATALRLAYAHGIESLFALTYAALQAPNCIQGWLHKYTMSDLLSISTKIREGHGILSAYPLAATDWESIVQALYAPVESPELATFARWYRWFARDLLKKAWRLEYNQVKHGIRARSTPAMIAFQPTEGGEAVSFSSDYGMGFSEAVEIVPKNTVNFRLRNHRINWTPSHLVQGLEVIAVLVHNLIAMLLHRLAGEEAHLQMPPKGVTIENFLATASHGFSGIQMNINYHVGPEDMIVGHDILNTYHRSPEAPAPRKLPQADVDRGDVV